MKFTLNSCFLLGLALVPQLSMAGMFAKPHLFLFENHGIKVNQLEKSTHYNQDFVKRLLTDDLRDDKYDYLLGEGGCYPDYQFCAVDVTPCEPILTPDDSCSVSSDTLTSSVSSSSSSDDIGEFNIKDRKLINELLAFEDNQEWEGYHLRKAIKRYKHNWNPGVRFHVKKACFYAERSKNNLDKAIHSGMVNGSLAESGFFSLFMAADALEKHRLMLCEYDKSVYLYEFIPRNSQNLEYVEDYISNFESSLLSVSSEVVNNEGFAPELSVMSARDNVQSLGGMLTDLQTQRKACEVYGKGESLLEIALMEKGASNTVEHCSQICEVREHSCANARSLQYSACMQVKGLYNDALATELKNRQLMNEGQEYISSSHIDKLKVSLLDIRNLVGCN
ncbi:MAG: hypothetical protein AB8G05_05320 [Oligoflexales bacterium]